MLQLFLLYRSCLSYLKSENVFAAETSDVLQALHAWSLGQHAHASVRISRQRFFMLHAEFRDNQDAWKHEHGSNVPIVQHGGAMV